MGGIKSADESFFYSFLWLSTRTQRSGKPLHAARHGPARPPQPNRTAMHTHTSRHAECGALSCCKSPSLKPSFCFSLLFLRSIQKVCLDPIPPISLMVWVCTGTRPVMPRESSPGSGGMGSTLPGDARILQRPTESPNITENILIPTLTYGQNSTEHPRKPPPPPPTPAPPSDTPAHRTAHIPSYPRRL